MQFLKIRSSSKNIRTGSNPILRTGVYPKSRVNFSQIYSKFLASFGSDTGSATSFLGVARRESANGKRKVRALVMESYEEHANRALEQISISVKKKFKLNEVVIIHALGTFLPGEPVVFVAVSSGRRDASFRGLREAVERYKKEPAIFKKEIYADGSSSWISGRDKSRILTIASKNQSIRATKTKNG
jgi:molybdopterin synthase catalytic subunit